MASKLGGEGNRIFLLIQEGNQNKRSKGKHDTQKTNYDANLKSHPQTQSLCMHTEIAGKEKATRKHILRIPDKM